ncbi:iron-containing alcohol dehydrogenase, partial [Schumannella sp. 10F1B-5-1]|uniref:iron-containing alcohol dehydrogenase n=1 Tax=Schumannella sp. 10F1B-5-1 TaxID=2590780 RepID=UPI001131CB56
IYTETGEFEEYRFFPRNPDLVLVDTQLVANAPAAFLAAGVGDALATWLEARATVASGSTTMAGGLATQAGAALARLSWDVLWEYALPALDAVRDKQVTPAVEKVVEANTLLSGLG